MTASGIVRLSTGGMIILIVAFGVIIAHAATTSTRAASPPQRVTMVIVPGVRLGPDHAMHDAFTPTDITARVDQMIVVTVYNYDTGPHSVSAAQLHLDAHIAATRTTGVAATTRFTFSVHKPGVYQWHCKMPCDDITHGWAMLHDSYMAGTITIERA